MEGMGLVRAFQLGYLFPGDEDEEPPSSGSAADDPQV
jgi:hypothetical protein